MSLKCSLFPQPVIVQVSAVISDLFGASSTEAMRSVMAIVAVVQSLIVTLWLYVWRVRGSPHWSQRQRAIRHSNRAVFSMLRTTLAANISSDLNRDKDPQLGGTPPN